MSRKDEVTVGPGGMISIAGGKLTGFRRLAEDVLDVVATRLGRSLPAGPGTAPLPGGAVVEIGDEADRLATRLRRLYGSEARDVAAFGAEPLVAGEPVLAGEVDWAIDVEAATTLVDVVYRRTRLAWYVPDRRAELAAAIADRMADRLGWSTEERSAQHDDVRARFADELAFRNGAT